MFLFHSRDLSNLGDLSKLSNLNTESRGTIYLYFEIGLKPAVVSCLTNDMAPPPIVLEKNRIFF